MAGNRRMQTKVLYGFPLRHAHDIFPSDNDRRFLCCSECAAPLDTALTCSACEAAIYCNVACQKAAWSKGHKQECADLQEDRKNSNGTIGMYQPAPRTATGKGAESVTSEAVKDWMCQNTQAIGVLAKLSCEGKKDLAINSHTYIMLISRTIRKKNQPDGYRLVVNSVYRVNRNRDYAVYQDLYDGKKVKKSDDQHVVQICTASTGINGIILRITDMMKDVTPAIPVHALVNMYNSNLQDLSVTGSRKVPEFGKYWKKNARGLPNGMLGKSPNVIDREKKELGVDKIPKDAMGRLQKMMDEARASKEGLQFAEVGREVIHPDGRKEYVASGWTINGQPVEAAVHPWCRLYFKNMSKKRFMLTTEPESMKRNNMDPNRLERQFYQTVLESVSKDPTGHGQPKETVAMAESMLVEDFMRMFCRAGPPKKNGEGGWEDTANSEDNSEEEKCLIS